MLQNRDFVMYVLLLTFGHFSLALPLQERVIGISSIPVPSRANGITLIKQNQPPLQIINANQLPVVLSAVPVSQSINSYQSVPSGIPVINGVASSQLLSPSGTTIYTGDISGSLPNVVSISPNLQTIQTTNEGNIAPSPYSSSNNEIIGTVLPNPTQVQYPIFIGKGNPQSLNNPAMFSTLNNLQNVGHSITLPLSRPISTNVGLSRLPVRGTVATLSVPNYGILQTVLNDRGPITTGTTTPLNDLGTLQQKPGLQAQVVQLPCTLTIPSPVPVTVNSGNSQILTHLPTQQSSIPSSFIDPSPPTIAILRPPTSQDAVLASDNFPIAAPNPVVSSQIDDSSSNGYSIIETKPSTAEFVSTIKERTKQKGRSQNPQGVSDQNNDTESELTTGAEYPSARTGLPLVYTVVPQTLSFTPAPTSAVETSKDKIKVGQTTGPSRGKNPFFNVNKRKHFEFYQYF